MTTDVYEDIIHEVELSLISNKKWRYGRKVLHNLVIVKSSGNVVAEYRHGFCERVVKIPLVSFHHMCSPFNEERILSKMNENIIVYNALIENEEDNVDVLHSIAGEIKTMKRWLDRANTLDRNSYSANQPDWFELPHRKYYKPYSDCTNDDFRIFI